jgi:fibronectin type III domain protein
MLLCATSMLGAVAIPGKSKALLFKQPNASAPAALLSDVISEVDQDYPAFTLASVATSLIATLEARAATANVEAVVRDEFDKIFLNGKVIDARIGTLASVPGATLSPPYPASGTGAYIVQFIGPILDSWVDQLRAVGAVPVQFVPFNAVIVGATPTAIQQIGALPVVQFIDQVHPFLKPSPAVREHPVHLPLQIEVIQTADAAGEIAALRQFSDGDLVTSSFSATELRVQGVFNIDYLQQILAEPLVFIVVIVPHTELSDERVTTSLTSNIGTQGQPTHPGRYKKWLGDTCPACTDLQADGYYVGFSDTGLDGGKTGSHRQEIDASRIKYGTDFDPQSNGTLHDTVGHGTMVVGAAAGDATGMQDANGFFLGSGVAPSAGIFVTKSTYCIPGLNGCTVQTSTADATRDARNNPDTTLPRVYVQNHSHNQYYATSYDETCYDGWYSQLSREFDAAVRDADATTTGNQELTLTVSSGNYPQQTSENGFCGGTALPPATAKNVIAVGMAESVRSDPAHQWNCREAASDSYSNIAFGTLKGTQTSGWYKPDLMAAASNISQVASNDAGTNSSGQRINLCIGTQLQATYNPPELPAAYEGSSGTSFSAPIAAGGALLAGRYYVQWLADHGIFTGNQSSASPALRKAMLIAGAKSMKGGLDRSLVRVWAPNSYDAVRYYNNDFVIPRSSNGHVYQQVADVTAAGAFSGTQEPAWSVMGDTVPDGSQLQWKDIGLETSLNTIEPAPNAQQGFGRLSLQDVLSSYPARDFINQDPALLVSTGVDRTKGYKVHEATLPVIVVLVWTDLPGIVHTSGTPPATELINDLNLTVEVGSPCTSRFVGNYFRTSDSGHEEESKNVACSAGLLDTTNNVEVVRFYPNSLSPAITQFTVRVTAASGVTGQDFALVVYNAYDASLTAPPSNPTSLDAHATDPTHVSLQWNASTGTGITYEIQRSAGAASSYVPISTTTTNPAYTDTGLSPTTTYLYRVRAKNSTGYSDFTNVDPATTALFTDDPLNTGVIVKAIHVTDLRTTINAMRAASGLSAYGWTDNTITAGQTTIRAAHMLDLRAALNEARSALDLPLQSFPSGSINAGSTSIMALHVQEVRNGVK